MGGCHALPPEVAVETSSQVYIVVYVWPTVFEVAVETSSQVYIAVYVWPRVFLRKV